MNPLVGEPPRFRSPLSPPLHFSTPSRPAHDLLSHTSRPHCWASRPHPHLQTWPPTGPAPQESALQPLSLLSRPLGILTIWFRFSTRPLLTLGFPLWVSPPSLLRIFPPFPSGNKCSYLYSALPFNRASILRQPLRVSRLKSTTYPAKLPTWISPRNPQTSPHSRHLSVTLPLAFLQPLRPLSLPNALAPHTRPHTSLLGLVPPPPATLTPLARRRGKEELLRLHPHRQPIRYGPPPQLTRISRDTTCQLPLPHYRATLSHLPKNTPTPGRRKNSPRVNTLPALLGPLAIWTPAGVPPPPWPPRPPPPIPKLPHPLLRERRVVRGRVLPRLHLLRLRRVRFLRNHLLPFPKPSAGSSPLEPPSNLTRKRSR